MNDSRLPRPRHRTLTVVLVMINLVAVAFAIAEGGPGQWDLHFRTESLISWLSSAQMVGVSLLFLACFFASDIIPNESGEKQNAYTWIVFSVGFFILALDQKFRLRDHLTRAIDGPSAMTDEASATATALKVIATGIALVMVVFFRRTVLANFRLVLAFFAGFWFLLSFLLINLLFEGIGVSGWTANILEGTAKLLAIAMFLSAAYATLLERLEAGSSAMHRYREILDHLRPQQQARARDRKPMAEADADAEADPESPKK